MRKSSFVVVALSLVMACSKDKPAEDKAAPASASAPSKTDAVEPVKKKASKPAPPKKEPSKKADADKLKTYWKAMNDGRAATRAKKFDDAYAAFDRALVAMPDDARAISERGYARLLAKDYQGALADLDKAVARTKDKKLLGQIYYNYGLAAEAKGDSAAARAAFARSHEYNPTPAAKKKLDGKPTCTAIITHDMGSGTSNIHDSWKAAYEATRADYQELEAWSSEDKTLGGFCEGGWKKGAACVAPLGQYAVFESRLFVPRDDGKVVTFDLAVVGGRCGGNIEAKLVSDENGVTHVRWTETQGIPIMVTEKNGEMVECTENDDECMTACGGDDEVRFNDLFVGRDKGEALLYVSREAEGDKDPLTLKVDGPTVKITGKGCDAERPLAK